jgi:hypothetical protein
LRLSRRAASAAKQLSRAAQASHTQIVSGLLFSSRWMSARNRSIRRHHRRVAEMGFAIADPAEIAATVEFIARNRGTGMAWIAQGSGTGRAPEGGLPEDHGGGSIRLSGPTAQKHSVLSGGRKPQRTSAMIFPARDGGAGSCDVVAAAAGALRRTGRG